MGFVMLIKHYSHLSKSKEIRLSYSKLVRITGIGFGKNLFVLRISESQ